MQSKNNSNPAICVNNLIQIARGEVPYDRIKGVSFAQLDAPIVSAGSDIIEDAEEMLDTYEPRADIESIELDPTDLQNGHASLKVQISTKEADT